MSSKAFASALIKKRYIQRNSMLATRWSVLISPSLNEQKQRLRISSDDAREIAKDITTELMQAREDEDWGTIEQIENEFFLPIVLRAMIVSHFHWYGFAWVEVIGSSMRAGTTANNISIKL